MHLRRHTPSHAAEPVCRAVGPDGDVVDDPSEDGLYRMIEDCEYDGDSVVVEKPNGHFARATCGNGREWVVEYETGSAEHRRRASTDDIDVVHQVLVRFGYDLPNWQRFLSWSKADIGS